MGLRPGLAGCRRGVTDDGNLVGLQVPRTCEAASWEPNDVYDELRHAGFSGCSEEDQEETFNRFLKPAAPPDSGNGVVVPHEAPDGPPKPKEEGQKMNQTPRVSWPLRHRGRLACTRSLERRTAGCVLFVTCYLLIYPR